jgi:hypothetical protein
VRAKGGGGLTAIGPVAAVRRRRRELASDQRAGVDRGAGPSGLTLACELARRGVSCRVVEKAAHGFVGSRAKGLQPRTLEVFDDLGVIDAVKAGGAPFPPFRLYAGSDLVWERSLEQMLG